jgi:hypothetical protein
MHPLISNLLHWFLYGGTLLFAAGAVAEPSAAAPAAAPAATPAAEPSTPAAPAAQPATPAAEPNIRDLVNEAAADAEKELTAAKPAEPAAAPAAEPAKPAAAEPAKPAAEPAKPAAEAQPAATEPNPLDKLGPLPAEKITAALAEAPAEVQQFLKDKGLSVESLTANARLAAQTSQFLERVPSIEALDVALEGNANFQRLETGLPAVQTVQDFDKFMTDTLVPMSFIRDGTGQPIPDPDIPGAFKNDGSIAKLIDYSAAVRDSKIVELADMMLKAATTDEDKAFATDLKGAMEFVGKFIDNGYRMPGAADGKTDLSKLPKEVQDRLARADKIERESRERDARSTQAALDQKEDRIISQTDKYVAPIIKDFLDKTALSAELKTLISETVWAKLTAQMDQNTVYKQQRDLLSPNAPDYEQRRVALNKQYMAERVVKILETVVGQIGGPVVDANKSRQEKLDSQSTASRMDPKTSGTQPQSFPAAGTTDQAHSKAMEMARAENPNAKEGGPEYWRAVIKLDSPATV